MTVEKRCPLKPDQEDKPVVFHFCGRDPKCYDPDITPEEVRALKCESCLDAVNGANLSSNIKELQDFETDTRNRCGAQATQPSP